MNTPSLPSAPTGKNFWSKPEGKAGILINLAIAAAAIYFWGTISAFVVAALLGGIQAVVLAGVLACMLYVMFDSNFRRLVWYMYRSAMRWLTGLVVNIDPIGILKSYMEKMREKKETMDDSIGELRGQRQKLFASIDANQRGFEESTAKLKLAKKRLDDPASSEETRRQANRIINVESPTLIDLRAMIKQQSGQLAQLDKMIATLTRYSEICEDNIVRFGRQIKIRQDAREQSRSFGKAMSAMKGILRGLPEQEESDMAIEALERDFFKTMGEIENAMQMTSSITTQADFDRSASVERAAAILDSPAQIEGAPASIKTSTPAKDAVPAQIPDYDDFFRK